MVAKGLMGSGKGGNGDFQVNRRKQVGFEI